MAVVRYQVYLGLPGRIAGQPPKPRNRRTPVPERRSKRAVSRSVVRERSRLSSVCYRIVKKCPPSTVFHLRTS